MAAVSCNKETEKPLKLGVETIEISVSALMPEYSEGVKGELVNTMRVSWKSGDVVYVYDGTQCLGSLVASLDGDEDRYALLSTDGSHTVKVPAEGTTVLTLVHSPLLTKAPAVAGNAISVSLAAQNSPKAPFVVFATLNYTGTSITGAIVPFRFATSVIKANCTGLQANTAITSATLNNVNTVCKLSLSGSTAPTVTGEADGIITRSGDTYFAAEKVNAEGVAVFQIAVPTLTAVEAGIRSLRILQGVSYFEDTNFTNIALPVATSLNTVCQLEKMAILPGKFSVATDRQVSFSQGNLYWDGSAFKFEDNQYDFYSSWDANHVSHFYWSTFAEMAVQQGYNDPTRGFHDVFFTNRTQTTTREGFTVKVNGKMCPGWRVLSMPEWLYLLNSRTVNGGTGNGKSYSLNITYGGKTGCVLYPDDYTGKPVSGTVTELPAGVVFLPAAGRRNGSEFSDTARGYYCTSTASDDDKYYAYFALFKTDRVEDWHSYRYYGCSARLVMDL